ncbi:MAG: hypothetical protein RL090_43 [Bacteroidota bacterium]|jgi:hypothetical protein
MVIPLLFCLLSCENGSKDPATTPDVPEEQEESLEFEPELEVLNFNYQYPKNILSNKESSVGENEFDPEIGFYPIGFSKTGLFAHLVRPCNGGCGCCQHDIFVQDLSTDKIVDIFHISNPDEGYDTETSHEVQWKRKYKLIKAFLMQYGISQSPLSLNRKSYLFHNGNEYKFTHVGKEQENPNSYYEMPELKYKVFATMNEKHSRTVSRGTIEDAFDFSYIGFLKSPFNEKLVLVYDSRAAGFERETYFEALTIGVTLEPKLFYR